MQLKAYCPYQVGDIYLTTAANNPTALWPGTTWERIQDCMLMLAGSKYAAGTTGGASTHTLSVDEIPSHKHQVPAHGHAHTIKATTPKFTHSITQPVFSVTGGAVTNGITGGSHTHNFNYKNAQSGGGTWSTGTNTNRDGSSSDCIQSSTHTHNLPAHTHTCSRTTNVAVGDHAATDCTMSGSVTDKAAFDTGNAGGGSSFSILNPYLAVYGWKRVA